MLFPSSSQVDVAVNNVLTLHLVGDGVVSSAEKKDQQQIRKCFSGVKLIIKHKRWFVGPLSLQLCIFARYLHVQHCTCAVYSAAEGCWAQLMVSRGPVNMWPHTITGHYEAGPVRTPDTCTSTLWSWRWRTVFGTLLTTWPRKMEDRQPIKAN